MAFSLPPFSLYLYRCNGKLATDSEITLTQAYTADVCIALLSFTLFPAVLCPRKKLYAPPAVLFVGASDYANLMADLEVIG